MAIINYQRFLLQSGYLLLLCLTNHHAHTFAFARQQQPHRHNRPVARSTLKETKPGFHVALRTRGGASGARTVSSSSADETKNASPEDTSPRRLLVAPILSLGKQYSVALESSPILTKSLTACLIFALSDFLAQRLEGNSKAEKPKLDGIRIFTSACVGLLCFGPGAHFWYNMIFRVFPGTGLWSTLQKAAMGQLFFGPSFTCIFFAASLLQTGQFSLSRWFGKIRRDLPGAWLAGLGFWPLVDLVSYSVVPVQFIPLFVNVCSLVWTIYLSTVANRAQRTD